MWRAAWSGSAAVRPAPSPAWWSPLPLLLLMLAWLLEALRWEMILLGTAVTLWAVLAAAPGHYPIVMALELAVPALLVLCSFALWLRVRW